MSATEEKASVEFERTVENLDKKQSVTQSVASRVSVRAANIRVEALAKEHGFEGLKNLNESVQRAADAFSDILLGRFDKKIKALPVGFFKWRTSFYVTDIVDETARSMRLSKPRALPFDRLNAESIADLELKVQDIKPAYLEWMKLNKILVDISCEPAEQVRAQVRTAVLAFQGRRISALVRDWPEVLELLPEYCFKRNSATGNLPAPIFSDLNAKIGLPTEAKAA